MREEDVPRFKGLDSFRHVQHEVSHTLRSHRIVNIVACNKRQISVSCRQLSAWLPDFFLCEVVQFGQCSGTAIKQSCISCFCISDKGLSSFCNALDYSHLPSGLSVTPIVDLHTFCQHSWSSFHPFLFLFLVSKMIV
jgi:hypothetical protein